MCSRRGPALLYPASEAITVPLVSSFLYRYATLDAVHEGLRWRINRRLSRAKAGIAAISGVRRLRPARVDRQLYMPLSYTSPQRSALTCYRGELLLDV